MSARYFLKLVKRLLISGAGGRKSILRKASPSGVAKPIASRGHFIVYTVDQKRYMVPITYLENENFPRNAGAIRGGVQPSGKQANRTSLPRVFHGTPDVDVRENLMELEKAILICNWVGESVDNTGTGHSTKL